MIMVKQKTKHSALFFCRQTMGKVAKHPHSKKAKPRSKHGNHCEWTEGIMSAAIEAVLQQRMSQRTACKTFGIPRCTLQMRLAGRTEQGTKPGRPTMLTHEQRISWSNMHATEQVWASALVDTSFLSGDYRLADGGGVSESGIRKTGAFLVAFCTKSSRYSIINFRTIGVYRTSPNIDLKMSGFVSDFTCS